MVIQRIGKIQIKYLLFGKLPSPRECIKWGLISALLGIIQFVDHLAYGYRIEELGFIPFLYYNTFATQGAARGAFCGRIEPRTGMASRI